MVLCFLFCIAYIIQFIVFPKVLFQGAMVDGLDVELRFRLTGQCLGTISFLMGIHRHILFICLNFFRFGGGHHGEESGTHMNMIRVN